MADRRALRLLVQGVRAWNKNRPDPESATKLDLTHVKIRNATLRGADLRNVDLNGVELSTVDLRGARLTGALVNGITAEEVLLDQADLTGAEIKGADFKWVSLRQAKARGCYIRQSRWRFSSLIETDLSGTTFDGVHIYNCDLSRADTSGATVVSGCFARRLMADTGRIEKLAALGFEIEEPYRPLRHEWHDFDSFTIAVPDDERDIVEYDGQLYPISEGRYDFFISHASVDKASVAIPLANALEQLGFRVWLDKSVVRPRDDLSKVISFGVRSSRYGIIVLSKSFFGRRWTEAEFQALSGTQLFLVLHGVRPDRLEEIRRGLGEQVTLSTDDGVNEVARRIADDVRRRRPQTFERLDDAVPVPRTDEKSDP